MDLSQICTSSLVQPMRGREEKEKNEKDKGREEREEYKDICTPTDPTLPYLFLVKFTGVSQLLSGHIPNSQ